MGASLPRLPAQPRAAPDLSASSGPVGGRSGRLGCRASGEFDSLTAQHESAEELPDEVDARFGELEAEIEQLEAKRQAYDPADIGALRGLCHPQS